MKNLINLTINQNKTIGEAFTKIDLNTYGIIFITDTDDKVIGCASDGDIRTKLLKGLVLENKIGLCSNENFKFCLESTPREQIIKNFDSSIRVIPLLDKNMKLIRVFSIDDFPINNENEVISRSKSPVRISFGGGGSDLTHYFSKSKGAVINTTISLYTHATLIKRSDKKVFIHSEDLKSKLEAEDLKSALNKNKSFGLITSIIKLINPDFGFELYLKSDFPVGSGLGGSAVVMSAIIGCFNEFKLDKWNKHEIAEMAYQAERLSFEISGGWQDQYATVFGGFNFMEFNFKDNIIHPLRISNECLLELKENLILCDTCSTHISSDIHDDQRKKLSDKKNINELVKLNVDLTYEIRDSLLKGDLSNIGLQLDKAWHYKRSFSDKISNKRLDNIYNTALKNGATGGKLLGAGGGGFFIFYCDPTKRNMVISKLESLKTKIVNFGFESEGLVSWRVRK
jgi:D-glycero-alpha-D-manno-heptose-7-phosphate kinase